MEEVDKIIQDKNKLLLIGGILHSRKAFVGPEVLHIDLTNRCNFDCIACWCRSPLLGDQGMPDWERKLTFSLDILSGVFDDLAEMGGLRQVKLVGGGEPFMHPDILRVIEYIKNKDKNIEIDINTNFSLVNEEIIERLFQLGVDSLTVSIWAGTPDIYAAVHPNQSELTFHRIKDKLKIISDYKKKLNLKHPKIIIHNVIFDLNYKDISQMIRFGLEVGADNIQFVPVDPVRGKTDALLLDDREKKELLEKLYEIKQRYDQRTCLYTYEGLGSIRLPDFHEFIRRIEVFNTVSGVYDEEVVNGVPCYVGWLFARIMSTGSVVPCCKGHRMSMGNIYKNRFKEIWLSAIYNEFRYNGINLAKNDPYFSKIGNDAVAKTGCYNCDNLWQNIPIHSRISSLKDNNSCLVSFSSCLLRSLFKDES